jgi:8-oxo-dGTP pyrophosphatase MutT (NUDIX family)
VPEGGEPDVSEPETTVLPLPDGLDATARAWLEAGGPPGPTPRPAASVCLLRDGSSGPEVLWITRGHQLSVAPGLLAFPGGAVDDADRRRRHDDPGVPDRFAVLARAAARELAEETGHVVNPHTLKPLVRWVTPEHEPRRYDSTFLVGAHHDPEEPEALPAGGEVHEHGWATPADLLGHVLAGDRTALPPTRAVLARLAAAVVGRDAAGAVEVLVAGAVLVPVVPRATWRDELPAPGGRPGVDLLLPRHAGDVP